MLRPLAIRVLGMRTLRRTLATSLTRASLSQRPRARLSVTRIYGIPIKIRDFRGFLRKKKKNLRE